MIIMHDQCRSGIANQQMMPYADMLQMCVHLFVSAVECQIKQGIE